VKLGDADYTATSGTSIVLGTGATVSDLVVIVAYDVFSVADTVSKADGGQFDGNVTMGGTLAVTGAFTSQGIDDNADATAITITSDEKVGINASSPARQLTVQNTIANAGGELGILSSDSSTTGTFGTLHFGNNTDTSLASIRAKADGSTTSGKLEFSTEVNGGAIETRMTIDSTGKVGIGTTPTAKLSLPAQASGDSGVARFAIESAVDSNDFTIAQYEDSSGTYTQIGQNVSLNSGGSTTVLDSDHKTASMFFDGRGNGALMFHTGGTNANAERMRIDSSGRVMIGNTTEGVAGADELTVGSTSGSNGITIRGGTSGTSSIYMSDATSGAGEYAGYIAYSHSGDTMAFATGSSERMRLTSGGAMTMGTTSSLTDVSGITLKHDDAGAYPTLLFLQNQPGSGGTMGADIHMGYASDYGTILRFYGNPFSSRPGGLQVRRVTGSGSSDLSFEIGTTGRTKIPNAYSETTGNSANLFVDTDGRLIRATSSERYKNTITDATHGLAEVLKLRSVTYKGNNDGDTVFGGLIAEEVHDAGLTEFVQYNEDNQPDALAYGNMVSLCIKAIQEQQATIEALTARIVTLENA
jgi:hypothetical protein